MLYTVQADIRYIDGTLAGIVIPGGYRVTVPDATHAARVERNLRRAAINGDTVRACLTGNRYAVVGNILTASVAPIPSL